MEERKARNYCLQKEKDNDFQSAKGGKKKQAVKKEEGPTDIALKHQMEILNYFDIIKATPPMH